jgi:hypothetical protein
MINPSRLIILAIFSGVLWAATIRLHSSYYLVSASLSTGLTAVCTLVYEAGHRRSQPSAASEELLVLGTIALCFGDEIVLEYYSKKNGYYPPHRWLGDASDEVVEQVLNEILSALERRFTNVELAWNSNSTTRSDWAGVTVACRVVRLSPSDYFNFVLSNEYKPVHFGDAFVDGRPLPALSRWVGNFASSTLAAQTVGESLPSFVPHHPHSLRYMPRLGEVSVVGERLSGEAAIESTTSVVA